MSSVNVRTVLFLLILFWNVAQGVASFGCTIFTATKDGTTLVGNNEDYLDPHSKIWFVPATDESYGCVYFTLGSQYPQGGMNDQGLFFDVATAPLSPGPVVPGKPSFPWNINHRFLTECANVEEALAFVQQFSYPFDMHSQTMFVDKTGAAAIIGWIAGEFKITRKTGAYQIMTNFSASNPELGNIPCRRYEIAEAMLRQGDVSVEAFRDILAAVHMEGESSTVYSNIYDLTRGLIHVYHFHNFGRAVTLDLAAELSQGERVIELPSLFPASFVQDFAIARQSHRLPVIPLLVCGLIFLAILILLVERSTIYCVEKFRRLRELPRTGVLAWLATVWMIASSVIGWVWMILILMNLENFAEYLSMGMARPVHPIFQLVTWIQIGLGTGMIVLTCANWLKRSWTLVERALMSVLTLAWLYYLYVLKQFDLLMV